MPIFMGVNSYLGHLCMCVLNLKARRTISFPQVNSNTLLCLDLWAFVRAASSVPSVWRLGSVQEQRDLERKYEELIAARGQLKGLCNKANRKTTWAQLQLGI